MSNESNFSSQQELFMEYLFNDPSCMNDTKLAADKAGYSSQSHSRLVREVKDEILKRAQTELAMKAPKAVSRLVETLDEDGSIPKAETRLKAAQDVLDRVGIAKKQQVEIDTGNSSPLFFISSKESSDS